MEQAGVLGQAACPKKAQLSILPLVSEIIFIGIYQHLQHTQQVEGEADEKKVFSFGCLFY